MSKKKQETVEEDLPEKEIIEPEDAPEAALPPDDDGNADESGADAADGTGITVDVLEQQVTEYKDKLMRLAAEFDNYKKRMARQFETVVQTANDGIITDTVEVFDNFERALDAAKTSADFDSFHQGVEMIFKQLQEVLGKRGVKPMDTAGAQFDPNMHDAIMMVENEEKESNEVVDVVQKGYVCGDRVLRHAKVTVNK